jgi:hypothetical protein
LTGDPAIDAAAALPAAGVPWALVGVVGLGVAVLVLGYGAWSRRRRSDALTRAAAQLARVAGADAAELTAVRRLAAQTRTPMAALLASGHALGEALTQAGVRLSRGEAAAAERLRARLG